jgi:hypothetical protein
MRAYPNPSLAESEGVAPLFCTSAKLFRAGTLNGAVFISNKFLVQCSAEAGLIGAPARDDKDPVHVAIVAIRSRARQAVCRGAGAVKRAGGDLGVPANFIKAAGAVASFATAAALTCWCGDAQAYRPFDSSDAAVAETGEMEIEHGPVEFLCDGSERTLFAPNLRINYGFTPGWEAVLEGIVAIAIGLREASASKYERREKNPGDGALMAYSTAASIASSVRRFASPDFQ